MNTFRFPLLVAILVFSQSCFAAATSLFGFGLEQFVWKEFDTDGSQLLKESGPRYVFTYQYQSERQDQMTYDFLADIYLGNVDYDGQTQTGIPVTSISEYVGVRAEALVGYHFLDGASSTLALIGGLGVDTWSRNLRDTFTSSGTPVSGYKENYFMIYAKLGLQYQFNLTNWQQKLRAGMRRPFYTEETIDEFSVTLKPKPSITFFAGWDHSWPLANNKTLGLNLYYEHTRFDASDAEPSSIGLVYQPESDMKIIGAKLLYSF